MWLTSNRPTLERTARCSSRMPEYCKGMSQPPKSTILAPILRCTELRAVLDSKAPDGGVFIWEHVENLVELGELHQVLHLGRELHELQYGALALGAGAGGDQFTEAAAVDVVDLGHVQKDLFSSGRDCVAEQLPQGLGGLAE